MSFSATEKKVRQSSPFFRLAQAIPRVIGSAKMQAPATHAKNQIFTCQEECRSIAATTSGSKSEIAFRLVETGGGRLRAVACGLARQAPHWSHQAGPAPSFSPQSRQYGVSWPCVPRQRQETFIVRPS